MNEAREPFSINDYKAKSKRVTLYTSIKKERVRSIFQEPHHWEHVRTVNGVKFINDSWATNINRTWYTLENSERDIVLILGASDNDFSIIHELIKVKVKAIVLLGKESKVKTSLKEITKVVAARYMSEAVDYAYRLSKHCGTVLLSPGCPSFDMFKDYHDRGNKFIEAVKNI